MKPDHATGLDDFIEGALRSEAMRPVPPGLRRRIQEKVRVAALLERERQRFRRCLAVAALVFLAILSSSGLAAVLGDARGAILGSVPGAMGLYDQFASRLTVWWPGLAGLAVVLACMVGLGSLLQEARRLCKAAPSE